MSRMGSRLARVERLTKGVSIIPQRVHFLTIDGDDNADAPIASMIAKGEAEESDMFIVTRIVDAQRLAQ